MKNGCILMENKTIRVNGIIVDSYFEEAACV